MLTQKERKAEYKRDHFAILRRKRGGEWIVRSYRYNALGMLHAKEASGNNTRTTLEELIAGKESADDPDGDADKPRTTTYVYDLTQPFYEVLTESTDNVTTAYTYGLERLAAYTEKAQTKYLYDGRGSVIQTNGESKFYSPFGELLTEKTSGYGFNGEYFDAATGMLNLRARQYEPAQGRFSQRDIEKGEAANAVSLNRYAFTWNDPVNLVDASGEKPEVVRNSITVDPGGGSAKKAVAQIVSEACKNTTVNTVERLRLSKTGVSHGGHSGKFLNTDKRKADNAVITITIDGLTETQPPMPPPTVPPQYYTFEPTTIPKDQRTPSPSISPLSTMRPVDIVLKAKTKLDDKGYNYNFEHATATKTIEEAQRIYAEAVQKSASSRKMEQELIDSVCIAGQLGYLRYKKVELITTYRRGKEAADKKLLHIDCSQAINYLSYGKITGGTSSMRGASGSLQKNGWLAANKEDYEIMKDTVGNLIFTKSSDGGHVMVSLGNGLIYDCSPELKRTNKPQGTVVRPFSELDPQRHKLVAVYYPGSNSTVRFSGDYIMDFLNGLDPERR